MAQHTSSSGLKFIEGLEGFVDHIYDDGTGVKTIGFGTTEADVSPLPAHVTREQAEQLLREGLARNYEPAIHALGRKLNRNQFDSLASFVYNLGPGIVGPEHTIGALLRRRQIGPHLLWNRRVANAMLLYSDPNNPVVHDGLLRRREAERALFLKKP